VTVCGARDTIAEVALGSRIKLKTDGLMRRAASDPTTLTLSFFVLAPRGIIVF
jgi:hypothetical protein